MKPDAIIAKIKQYPIASGAGVLAVVLAVLLYLLGPRVEALESELSDLESELQTIETNAAQAVGLDIQVETVQKALDDITGRLIDRNAKAVNLDYFYSLERETGLTIVDVSQSNPVASAKPNPGKPQLNLYEAIGFRVVIDGGFRQVLKFLYELERGAHFTRIDSFNLAESSGGSPEAPPGVAATIELDMLGRKPK